MCKTVFTSWANEKQFDTSATDRYPLLFSVYRDISGDYSFHRIIEGSNKKLNIDEFLVCLSELKDKFNLSEQQLEKAKV